MNRFCSSIFLVTVSQFVAFPLCAEGVSPVVSSDGKIPPKKHIAICISGDDGVDAVESYYHEIFPDDGYSIVEDLRKIPAEDIDEYSLVYVGPSNVDGGGCASIIDELMIKVVDVSRIHDAGADLSKIFPGVVFGPGAASQTIFTSRFFHTSPDGYDIYVAVCSPEYSGCLSTALPEIFGR